MKPKGAGGCSPGLCPFWGGRGAEAPTAIGNRVLTSPTMPLAARLGSLGTYIIFFFFFFGETVLCFLVWFCFGFVGFFFFPLVEKSEAFFLYAYLDDRYPYLFVVNVAAVFRLSCVCPPTQVRICKVYMLVHYCGDPGACNNNEAKNLPSPLSSHPLDPKLCGLAAVWRGCCSFFCSSCSRVPCIFLFTLPFGSSAGLTQP